MATLKVSWLFACFLDLCTTLHSPIVTDVHTAANSANSSDMLLQTIHAEESATTDLIKVAKANLNSRQEAVESAATAEGRKLAEIALEEAKTVLGRVEAASSTLKRVKADLPARPDAQVSPNDGDTLKVIVVSPELDVFPSSPHTTPSPVEQKEADAVDEVEGSTGTVEDVSTTRPKEVSFTSTAATTGTTSSGSGTTTSRRGATLTTTPAATTATTTELDASEEKDEPCDARVEDGTTETSTKAELAKQRTQQAACVTKGNKNKQRAQKEPVSAKKVNVESKHTAKAAAEAGKAAEKAIAANARAESVIRSAKIAWAAAKRTMDLATGDAEKQAARAAMQSAKVLIVRGKMMQRKAKMVEVDLKQTPEKAGISSDKRQFAKVQVDEALVGDMVHLARDSVTVLKKVALALPGAHQGFIDLLKALKTATLTLGENLEGKTSGFVNDLVEKAAKKASKALRYGWNAVDGIDPDLQEHVKDLIDKARKIESKAKADEREGIISKMHDDAREVREKSVTKGAEAKVTKAMKTAKKVIKKADVGVAALSKNLKKEPRKTVQKAKKRISRSSDMVVKAFGVKAQAAVVKAAAERKVGTKGKETSIAKASKLRKKAEKVAEKANSLNEKEKANLKGDIKLAATNERALRDETTALKGQAEAKLKKVKVGIPKLEKTLQEDIDELIDEIKRAPEKEQRQMAKKELQMTKRAQAKVEADKKKVAKIDKAISKATKCTEPHVGQLKALKKQTNKLDKRVEADRETASKEKEMNEKLLADIVATKANKKIEKLKVEAGKVKKNAKVAKQIGRGVIKTIPRSAKNMLGDVKKATSLKLESAKEAEYANQLANEAMQAAADPAHAAEKFKDIARKAELAARKAQDKVHEAGRVKKRIGSAAKKVLDAGEKKLEKKEKKLQARADALKKGRLEQEDAELVNAAEVEVEDANQPEIESMEVEVEDGEEPESAEEVEVDGGNDLSD
eukprot:TRINITY_DN1742_c0_g1_i1.p1 TRINITY_DN1742_c0_g1~~TRINITY_DN1742_c0_g1_i1.p1  ORF type:complete len:971 (-),score=274.34 TRINITY_DN1742_c0_g1_i1:83-2995(-)